MSLEIAVSRVHEVGRSTAAAKMADAPPLAPHVLAALAAERRARAEANGTAQTAAPAPTPAAAARARAAAPKAPPPSFEKLSNAHRSIKLAHMAGIIGQFIALLAFLLFGSWRAAVVLMLVGAGLARGGGAWLHGVVPDMLREGKPPTPEQMAAAAPVLFGPHGVQNGGASLSFAWELMLENLAYTCTYGRKNCLTDKIYGSGPLTLGKIVGPVAGKLSEGVVRC